MAEHSPTPWRVAEDWDLDGDPIIGVVDADGVLVNESHGCGDTTDCTIYSNMLKADAELIVKAVNNHEKLVDIVKDLMVMLDPDGAVTPFVRDFHLSAVKTYLSLLEEA